MTLLTANWKVIRMGLFLQIIQDHLDKTGVREAEFARRIGTAPQTVNAWRKRGIRGLPNRELLQGVADVTGTPYMDVLDAVLTDMGYLRAERIDTDRFMEEFGLHSDDDDWWMDDVTELAQTYLKIADIWGHEEQAFLEVLKSMPQPRVRPTRTGYYDLLFMQVHEYLEDRSSTVLDGTEDVPPNSGDTFTFDPPTGEQRFHEPELRAAMNETGRPEPESELVDEPNDDFEGR